MSAIAASVIIPTYNRPAQLQRVLEALSRQVFPVDCTEVLIIDDGSSEPYDEVTRRAWPFHLRYLRQENQGEIAARALAVSAAASDFFIFLDDDIYAEPTYISALVEEHQRYPEAILMGVMYTYLGPNPSLFKQVMATENEDATPGEISYIDIGSGTMAVSRAVYNTAGGMRRLGPGGRNAWGGMDFAYRAYQAGYKARKVAQAIAYHDDYAVSSLETMSQRMWKVSRMAVLHLQRSPELLDQIPMFRDKIPVDLRKDSPALVTRKLARSMWSSRPAIRVMQAAVRFLEKRWPSRKMLAPLYLWIVRGHIYQGYRAGLREYGAVKP